MSQQHGGRNDCPVAAYCPTGEMIHSHLILTLWPIVKENIYRTRLSVIFLILPLFWATLKTASSSGYVGLGTLHATDPVIPPRLDSRWTEWKGQSDAVIDPATVLDVQRSIWHGLSVLVIVALISGNLPRRSFSVRPSLRSASSDFDVWSIQRICKRDIHPGFSGGFSGRENVIYFIFVPPMEEGERAREPAIIFHSILRLFPHQFTSCHQYNYFECSLVHTPTFFRAKKSRIRIFHIKHLSVRAHHHLRRPCDHC